MNTLTVYGVVAVVAIVLISNNASAFPTIEDKAEREVKVYDDKTRDNEKTLADEINIVFAESDLDIEPEREIFKMRYPLQNTRNGRHWQQIRDRRQSWNPQGYLDNFFGSTIQPQNIYGSIYDAYGTPPSKTDSRNFYQYPVPNLISPFNPPQYLPPPIQPTTVNNYYFIGIPIAPWRVDNPWFSAPFPFAPICTPSQTPEPPTTPTIPNIEPTNSTDGSDIADRTGFISEVNNNSITNNVNNPFPNPNNKPITSPIDLTPAKPKRPLSRPPPDTDHRAISNTLPASNTRRPTVSRPRRPTTQSQVTNINSNKINNAPSPFEDRISTPAPDSNIGSDPPSRCINAIISCCRPNSTAYSQTCFENLGCNGIFWDGNPCGGEVAKAAMNVYNIFRNRFRS